MRFGNAFRLIDHLNALNDCAEFETRVIYSLEY